VVGLYYKGWKSSQGTLATGGHVFVIKSGTSNWGIGPWQWVEKAGKGRCKQKNGVTLPNKTRTIQCWYRGRRGGEGTPLLAQGASVPLVQEYVKRKKTNIKSNAYSHLRRKKKGTLYSSFQQCFQK